MEVLELGRYLNTEALIEDVDPDFKLKSFVSKSAFLNLIKEGVERQEAPPINLNHDPYDSRN